jgi:FkbH-like protein
MAAATSHVTRDQADHIRRGDELKRSGDIAGAISAYLAAAQESEIPPAGLCLQLARAYSTAGDSVQACRWATAVVDTGDDFTSWQAAAAIARRAGMAGAVRRTARLALLGSYTTVQFAPLLQLAALRFGIRLEIYESPYGQYRQELLDPGSACCAFAPELVLLAVHEGEIALPGYSQDPASDLQAELSRWTSLWDLITARTQAIPVQHNFVLPPESALGHLGTRLPGSRYRLMQELNARLGELAGASVAVVDCERIAAEFGKKKWFDPRYWHLSKQAVALEALPLLARQTAAVIVAALGLSRKCLVMDLDNTLWGGVIGEDLLGGIKIGEGAAGEAYAAFQSYILELKRKGVILAVCSKNNLTDAKKPFLEHPGMRLRLEDLSMFVANWETKPDNLRHIAEALNIGLDSIAFVDDNPLERQFVRRVLPEVEVIPLPADPALYTRALAEFPLFETNSFTPEDASRTEQYRARAMAAEMSGSHTSLEDFLLSLNMQAIIEPFTETRLPRIVQLLGKTNQFNLTTRRYSIDRVRDFMRDPACVHFCLQLRDRFTDHGLVALMIAFAREGVLEIDTCLMSCRVIGRTVEAEMLKHLCLMAREKGCTAIRGFYFPTPKNGLVKDLYAKFGFTLEQENDQGSVWTYDMEALGPVRNQTIQITTLQDAIQ